MRRTVVLAMLVSTHSFAMSMVDAQIKLLTEKADLCIRSSSSKSPFCEDFISYKRYIFKGEREVWLGHHMATGELNSRNGNELRRMLNMVIEADERISK
jgi:hypothetical protein